METIPPTRRRWFRFSLRTLLVLVTLVCVYLGWAMNWIHQREAYRESMGENQPWVSIVDSTPAPWSLRILQEQGNSFFVYMSADETQLVAASRLFPEARIIFYQITKHGVPYRPTKLGIFSVPPIFDLPYYQNGILFREELLEAVGENE